MIRLEPFSEKHLDQLGPLLADPDVHRFTRIPVPPPPDFPRRWLEIYEAGRTGGTKEAFAIVDDGNFLGLVMAPTIDRVAGEAELGYAIAPAARGKGVATEALRLLTEWAFAELNIVRLELLISVDNPASKRVAERCGYTLEGVMRDRYVKPGLRVDTEIWSLLATDTE